VFCEEKKARMGNQERNWFVRSFPCTKDQVYGGFLLNITGETSELGLSPAAVSSG
jgi:hypothetical protein